MAQDPDVIVDFVFEDGLLFVALRNIGSRPAYDVSTRFDKAFRGLHGTREISELRLFRRLPFLAPGREIRAFLDASAAYFRRREPTRISAVVSYRTASGERHEHTLKHDLAVYRELGYVRREARE